MDIWKNEWTECKLTLFFISELLLDSSGSSFSSIIFIGIVQNLILSCTFSCNLSSPVFISSAAECLLFENKALQSLLNKICLFGDWSISPRKKKKLTSVSHASELQGHKALFSFCHFLLHSVVSQSGAQTVSPIGDGVGVAGRKPGPGSLSEDRW